MAKSLSSAAQRGHRSAAIRLGRSFGIPGSVNPTRSRFEAMEAGRQQHAGLLAKPSRHLGHIVAKADCHCRASVISLTDRKTTLRYQTRVRHWLALSQMLFT